MFIILVFKKHFHSAPDNTSILHVQKDKININHAIELPFTFSSSVNTIILARAKINIITFWKPKTFWGYFGDFKLYNFSRSILKSYQKEI